jgi:hypothetical protein
MGINCGDQGAGILMASGAIVFSGDVICGVD